MGNTKLSMIQSEPVQAKTDVRTNGSPYFSEQEIKEVRDGVDGLKSMLPARCYYDNDIYNYEVENILKKNWLCVGRWDWAENPGDYFTTRMFGEPIVIVRGQDSELRALINVCQHRWAQVVPDGSGNTKLFVCPFHSWTYGLDGQLRGIAARSLPGFDKKNCSMPSLRLEVWEGFIFINFDQEAKPLAPQLEGLKDVIGRHGLSEYRSGGRVEYETQWNYKLSFETGYEAYHHEGCHKSILGGTAHQYGPIAFGDIWGVYAGEPEDGRHAYPFGKPSWFTPDDEENFDEKSIFIGIYPSLITYLNTHQVTFIVTEYDEVSRNRAITANAFAPWAFGRPGADDLMKEQNGRMAFVQDQDTSCCQNLQKGLRSSYNTKSVVHPLESQLSHYYNWVMGHYLK
ncbi:aromatic ring-hydroxylating dioxygenase subunit alpha [Phyllobacterium sp. YR531]|uniref:aromatic ring-hydroxylating oxygenase subunit alpha n=1 Tax=Phyllobacterium sp. YR531 TaxID=1144343 RepID=UPI00026FBA85|nr:aromatic ring-hydroxylating dioxygenase subunit alpha [Phyllobacterium sp. YR531]EJN05855.1 ring-hydroxylating dioxygenase, large terminal subunit [Phyllobacterium sp. YR531]